MPLRLTVFREIAIMLAPRSFSPSYDSRKGKVPAKAGVSLNDYTNALDSPTGKLKLGLGTMLFLARCSEL